MLELRVRLLLGVDLPDVSAAQLCFQPLPSHFPAAVEASRHSVCHQWSADTAL